jgi:hypothetical protein
VVHSVSLHPDLPVAGKGGNRNYYKVMNGNPQLKRPLAKPRPTGDFNLKKVKLSLYLTKQTLTP